MFDSIRHSLRYKIKRHLKQTKVSKRNIRNIKKRDLDIF